MRHTFVFHCHVSVCLRAATSLAVFHSLLAVAGARSLLTRRQLMPRVPLFLSPSFRRQRGGRINRRRSRRQDHATSETLDFDSRRRRAPVAGAATAGTFVRTNGDAAHAEFISSGEREKTQLHR